jgi:hypothetical protein
VLETDHTWVFKFKEKVEKDEDDEDERWDFGEYTKDNFSSKPEEYEIFEPRDNPGNDKFYVNCAGCDREIEFGWSESISPLRHIRFTARRACHAVSFYFLLNMSPITRWRPI